MIPLTWGIQKTELLKPTGQINMKQAQGKNTELMKTEKRMVVTRVLGYGNWEDVYGFNLTTSR